MDTWNEEHIKQLKDDDETGYFFDVDLEYPKELHDLHNDYPLAPESMEILPGMLSAYQNKMLQSFDMKPSNVPKLVPNLYNKTHFVLHYRNLKLCLQLGMKLTKDWLKSYINFNTSTHALATSDFEKDLFKLMNNSVFGKTMENVKNHVDVQLVTTKEKLNKLSSKVWYETSQIINEDMTIVKLKKSQHILNKPISVGFAILDLSKVLMYDFHYNTIKAEYGSNHHITIQTHYAIILKLMIYIKISRNISNYTISQDLKNHTFYLVMRIKR